MCRYAFHRYKPHYVCFDCRKTFKQTLLEDMMMQNGDWEVYKQAYVNYDSDKSKKFRAENLQLIHYLEERYINKKYLCPDCGGEMNNIGLDFKAPKREKVEEWKVVRSMYKLGNTFHSCGCYGPGYIPHEVKDYLAFLQEIKQAYEQSLHERKEIGTEEELTSYINYWLFKLNKVKLEIKKVEAGII